MAGIRLETPIASGWPRRQPAQGISLPALLLSGVDLGLAAALFLVPLAMGGRAAAGKLALAAAALTVAVCWCLRCWMTARPHWSWSWAHAVLLGAVGLLLLQTVTLPPGVLQTLSPHLYEKLPLWAPDAPTPSRLGVWSTLSLAPAQTRSALIVLVSHGLLFLVALQRVRTIEDIERIVRWVALAGSAMAVFGLLQYLFGNGKFFWFYEYPYINSLHVPTGSFPNRNHFAHFVVLAIGPLLWWIYASQNDDVGQEHHRHSPHGRPHSRSSRAGRLNDPTVLLVVALGTCAFAVLLSLSRGGAVVMFLATAIGVLILYRASLLNGRTVLLLLAAGAMLLACLAIYGFDLVSSRLEHVDAAELLGGDVGRAAIWRADALAIADFPWTGSGAASHAQVYPLYLPDDEANQYLEYVHADNGYLEIGLEAGVASMLLLGAAIGLGVCWCAAPLRGHASRRLVLCVVGIAPSLAASVVHSLCDFVWYIPGCVVPVLLLGACACRLRQLSTEGNATAQSGLAIPRVAWAGALVGLGLLGYPMIAATFAGLQAEPNWQRADVQARRLASLDPSARHEALTAIAAELGEVVRWQPNHAVAHARLAEVHIQLFSSSPDAGVAFHARQVRQTALASASHFQGQDDLQRWLRRAFGDQCEHLYAAQSHARRALAACPLLANAYLSLATVGFVDGDQTPAASLCVEQALRVRPYDGAVLFAAGQEAMLAGDADRALEWWRKSFQCGSYHQQRLIDLLVDQVPAEFFVQNFALDLAALKRLEARYQKANRPEETRALLRPRAEAAAALAGQAEPAQAKQAWLDAACAYGQLGETAARLECLRSAVRCDTSDYQSHLALGTALREAKEYAEAKEHLNWCLRRKPRDANVRAQLDTLLNEELRAADRPEQKTDRPSVAGRCEGLRVHKGI